MSDPYCLALILCDAVHRDPSTHKLTILGTFSTVTSSEWPTQLDFSVYNAVTDVSDEVVLTFQLVDSAHGFDESRDPLFSIDVPIHSPSPLAVIEGRMHVQAVSIPKPGVYHCELLHDGNVLMARRLVAVSHEAEESGDEATI